MDLTRSVPSGVSNAANSASSSSAASDREAATKRLAFSVENILDPNKFTGNKLPGATATPPFGHPRAAWNGYERDDDMQEHLDDEHSEDMSGECGRSGNLLYISS